MSILMNKFSKYLYIIIAIAIIFGGYFVFFKKSAEAPIENNIIILEKKENNLSKEEKISPKPETLPDKISIKVPFTSQAPFANWDDYHEEACEEASLIMLKYYLDKKPLNKDIAEMEIQKLIAFQIKNYGDYKDSTAEQAIELFNDFYGPPAGGKNLKVIYDFEKEEIKKELAKNNPIIIPAAGRLLKNPNFKVPGPLYHMLILTGYNGNMIITNDPGTKKGENYKYDIDVLYNAIHDFPGKKEDIEKGRKAMIVLTRE